MQNVLPETAFLVGEESTFSALVVLGFFLYLEYRNKLTKATAAIARVLGTLVEVLVGVVEVEEGDVVITI
jgi:hypothetical protein